MEPMEPMEPTQPQPQQQPAATPSAGARIGALAKRFSESQRARTEAWEAQQRAQLAAQQAMRPMQQPAYAGGATTQRTYKSQGAMQHGIAQMARGGWRVVSTLEHQPSAGLGRIFLLGLFAAVFKPKPVFIVTYAR